MPETGSAESILRAHDGTRLCALPCTLPIPYGAGYYVDVDKAQTLRRVNIPGDLGPEGSRMTAVVLRKEGHPGAALPLALSAMAPLFFGGSCLVICRSAYAEAARGGDTAGGKNFCGLGIGLAGVGVGMVIAATIFGVTSRRPGLEVLSRSASE